MKNFLTLNKTINQKRHDSDLYTKFKKNLVNTLYEQLEKEYQKVKNYVSLYGIEEVTLAEFFECEEKYKKYVEKCKKLDFIFILNQEEFALLQKNIHLRSFKMHIADVTGTYTIYDEDAAEFAKGNVIDNLYAKFNKEFK